MNEFDFSVLTAGEPAQFGKYGSLRLRYLKENKPTLYQALLQGHMLRVQIAVVIILLLVGKVRYVAILTGQQVIFTQPNTRYVLQHFQTQMFHGPVCFSKHLISTNTLQQLHSPDLL